MFELAAPRLYSYLEVDPKNRQDSHPFHALDADSGEAIIGSSQGSTRRIPTKASMLAQTRTLRLSWHPACDDTHLHAPALTSLSNLRTIRLDFEFDEMRSLSFCRSSGLGGRVFTPTSFPSSDPRVCPLLAPLRPKRLVITGVLGSMHPNVLHGDKAWTSEVEELVFKLDMAAFWPKANTPSLPRKVKRIVYVFNRHPSGDRSFPKSDSPYPHLPALASALAHLSTKLKVEIVVVNAGGLNAKWLGVEEGNVQEVQERVRHAVEDRVERRRAKNGAGDDNRNSEVATEVIRVKWMTMPQFMWSDMSEGV
jgi:hypothetical protein